MAKMMFQFRHPQGTPTVEDVRRRFGFRDDEIDPEYGVVGVDERERLYVVLVEESARARLGPPAPDADPREGFFSNPRIEPFGPPEP